MEVLVIVLMVLALGFFGFEVYNLVSALIKRRKAKKSVETDVPNDRKE